MTPTEMAQAMRRKVSTYTKPMLTFALLDCHAALQAGGYSTDHPYGAKLWAEIDAIRDRMMRK